MERRRAMMARVESSAGRLPARYQEVEYLESDENQRIILNIYPLITDVISIKYKLTNISKNTGIWGSAYANTIFFGIGTNTSMDNYYVQTAGGNYRQSSVPKDTNVHTHVLDIPRMVYAIDGIEKSLAGLNVDTNTGNTYGLWFHHGADNRYIRYTAGRIYFFSIPDRANLIPCYRKQDSKPGMYDLVSGEFFTNAGTGEFLVGPDVN